MSAAEARAGVDTAVPPPLDRREQAIEVSVFLLLIVPSMVLGLFVVRQGGLGFAVTAWATILRDAGLGALVWFLVWRNGEPVARIGWSLRNGWREAALGAALFLPVTYGASALDGMLQAAGLSPPATPTPAFLPGSAAGAGQIALAVLLVSIVAVSEETVFRGYLIARFTAVTRSPQAAVWLSSFVFALGHGYEGASGLATVGAIGLVLGLVYLWRGSLVAPMVIHFLQDFVGIVLPPLLARS